MHVGINAQIVTHAAGYRQAGVSRFTEQLVLALQSRDRTNQYSVYVNGIDARGGFSDSHNVHFHRSHLPTDRPTVRILWEQFVLPELAGFHRLDLLHCPVNVQPLLSPCRTVLTIHDLTFMLFPNRFRGNRRRYLQAMTRLSAKRATRIMTDSANTRLDVIRLLGVPAHRVRVVYPGLDETFRVLPPAEVASFRERRGLPDQFILYVGTLEPRKNVDRLIQAYALLFEGGLKCPLIVAGGQGWMFDHIYAQVEQSGLKDHVIFPGYVETADLPFWYNAASVFVYPSLYEGFGLPPLEAMACGAPVVVSNVSSLPEVVGNAGMAVDPYQPGELAEAIAETLQSSAKREVMIEAGLKQANLFTWDRAASATLETYRQAMN